MEPVILGVAGGTGSGKTTVAMEILKRVGTDRIAYIPHDAYYRDWPDLTPAERARQNFDHPDSLESELLVQHLRQLRQKQTVKVPIYDFTTHRRTDQSKTVHSQQVVLVEGILVFADAKLREEFDVKLYVDTDADIRFIRRLQRDIQERGRSVDSVIEQYLNTVRPMHLEFVEPSKRHADVIIPEGGHNVVAIEMVASRIEHLLAQE